MNYVRYVVKNYVENIPCLLNAALMQKTSLKEAERLMKIILKKKVDFYKQIILLS